MAQSPARVILLGEPDEALACKDEAVIRVHAPAREAPSELAIAEDLRVILPTHPEHLTGLATARSEDGPDGSSRRA